MHVTVDIETGDVFETAGPPVFVAAERQGAPQTEMSARSDDAMVTVGDLRRLGLVGGGTK